MSGSPPPINSVTVARDGLTDLPFPPNHLCVSSTPGLASGPSMTLRSAVSLVVGSLVSHDTTFGPQWLALFFGASLLRPIMVPPACHSFILILPVILLGAVYLAREKAHKYIVALKVKGGHFKKLSSSIRHYHELLLSSALVRVCLVNRSLRRSSW